MNLISVMLMHQNGLSHMLPTTCKKGKPNVLLSKTMLNTPLMLIPITESQPISEIILHQNLWEKQKNQHWNLWCLILYQYFWRPGYYPIRNLHWSHCPQKSPSRSLWFWKSLIWWICSSRWVLSIWLGQMVWYRISFTLPLSS